MKIAVRYYSKSGSTKKVAEAISSAVNCTAKTVEEPLAQEVDILFLGGALYAGGTLDNHLKDFVKSLSVDKVKKIVTFSTSNTLKSIGPKLSKLLEDKDIEVCEESFQCHGKFMIINKNKPSEQDLKDAVNFAKKIINE